MPNKNYIKGRKKEYKICKRLKDKGYDIAQRTAGSHSPFDVIGIDMKNKVITLVQSKPEGYDEKNKYNKELIELNKVYRVEYIIE